MLRAARRRLAVLAAATLCAVATITAAAAPAHAAASGRLLIKGTGSVYAHNNVVNLGIIPGQGTKSWSYKVVNTGSAPQQFKLTYDTSGPGFTATLFRGYNAVPSPFYTAPVPAGGTVTFTLKIAVAAGQPQGEYVAGVTLRDPETGSPLDITEYADANATYQTGTTRHDLFLKTGSQPFVGGSVGQFITANTIKIGQVATFTVRLQNDGGAPAPIHLDGGEANLCPGSFAWTAKDGTTDVTAAVDAGTYFVGLDPGARKQIKISIKLVGDTVCPQEYFFFTATGPDGSVGSGAHVVTLG